MKIGIDISQIIYGTGVSFYTKNLVSNLLSCDKENEYILFGSSLRRKNELQGITRESKNVSKKIFPFPPRVLEYLWNNLHVLPIERMVGKIDLFHSSDWLEPPANCPKVTTIHDLVVYKYPESLPLKIINNQKRKLSWVIKESKAIIAVSKNTKQDIIDILKIPEDKIKVIYEAPNKIFQGQSRDSIEKIKLKYKLSEDYVLSIGTIEPRKNIEKLIKAFLLLSKDIPNLQLVLVGKYGWGEKLQINDNKIRSLGYVLREDLPALYAGSACFAYPSLYEGFGLPILEAMASGTPVVTSNCSSMVEISKEAAVLVDPLKEDNIAEGICKAIKNRESLIDKGFKRSKEFSWEKCTKETLDLYKEVAYNNLK